MKTLASTGAVLAALIGAAALAPAARAATQPGDNVSLTLGSISSQKDLTFTGTYSCTGTSPATINILVRQLARDRASASKYIEVSCPATAKTFSGTLHSYTGSWSGTVSKTWFAQMEGTVHVPRARQEGFRYRDGQEDAVTVTSAVPNAAGGLTVSGTYSCGEPAPGYIFWIRAAGQESGLGKRPSTGSVQVSCPTTGPAPYTVDTGPGVTFTTGQRVPVKVWLSSNYRGNEDLFLKSLPYLYIEYFGTIGGPLAENIAAFDMP